MPTTLVPLDQYPGHAGDFEPEADYVDGEIELRPLGLLDHASWQYAIQRWFDGHCEIEQLPNRLCFIDWAQVKNLMDC